MSDPFVCARCAAKGPTCCELTPGTEEVIFPISEYERERIMECVPDSGGFGLQLNTPAFIENMLKLFPGQRRRVKELFPPGGMHYRLEVDSAGKCLFLGSGGCVIPKEARPLYCRLFPFWTDESGRITLLDVETCLAQQENKTPGKLFKTLGVTQSEVRDLHSKLRIAWGFAAHVD
ncbi:YkgJ family cysteine cluster protein [Desulfovibrio sp. JC010]|uniref:YkgJ family cysteine cluster protein n=1 Tax=Desulfovibrio sp. JC010 TaxID=2593641 RepID=UPI0013D60179|nr:YkgJ family cysteine cluster protein [Desulfovibrio sp. JC010]NDV27603.1 YkgJ family cysteine cluster protein [Desulfovibrio sp. JC010]